MADTPGPTEGQPLPESGAAIERQRAADSFRRYYKPLMVVLRRLDSSSSEQDREDAAQQAFLEVVVRCPEDGPTTMSRLIRRARSRLTDVQRGDSARRQREQGGLPTDWNEEAASPLAFLCTQEQREQVRATLAQLPPNQRRAIELIDLSGLKITRAAEKMELSISQVTGHHQRGKRFLAKALSANIA